MNRGGNRSILWDHFVDVLVVLTMEAALTWLAILIVTQFAVCSLALLTARNWTAVREAWKS